jgi:hypothetical protein
MKNIFQNATKSTIVFSFKDEDHKPVDKDCPADKSFNYFTQVSAFSYFLSIKYFTEYIWSNDYLNEKKQACYSRLKYATQHF